MGDIIELNELSPKEKAIEMLNNYRPLCGGYNGGKLNKVFAKQCVNFSINEILKVTFEKDNIYYYYLEVQQELEKL
jgi:hypothetical protein